MYLEKLGRSSPWEMLGSFETAVWVGNVSDGGYTYGHLRQET